MTSTQPLSPNIVTLGVSTSPYEFWSDMVQPLAATGESVQKNTSM